MCIRDRSSTLAKHKLGHGETKRRYHCDICNNAFSSPRNVARHKEIHKGIKRYHCDICNKAFNWLTGLAVHKVTHTDIKHQCNICNRNLSSASNLTRHRLTVHTDIHKGDVYKRQQLVFFKVHYFY